MRLINVRYLLTYLLTSKSSPLDVVPTSLLKKCNETFSHIIAQLANISFQHSQFPSRFKMAQITPLLKRQGLEAGEPANYRPISNLNTISKILERLVLKRITSHVNSSLSLDRLQSAYRQYHSTETTLLKVTDDIYEAFNDGRSTLLVALDQSAAFDCIDHDTMLRRLQYTFGLDGAALNWLRSYLDGRSSFVRLGSCVSDSVDVKIGVPQGSSLGPKLFSLYISPMAGLIESFGVRYHQYADDTQMYIAISKSDVTVQIGTLERCISAVHEWLLHNGLSLNPTKSDAIQFSISRARSSAASIASVNVSGAVIQPAPTVKSLGVTLDTHLSFDQHVDNVCKSCYYHIRALRRVRDSLPDDVAKTVASSIVTSRLDYCNSLYYNMSSANVAKLQRVQNTLARVVLRQRKSDHISPSLVRLHWLPVKHRITFKVATLTFKLLHSHQPAYLYELINIYTPVRDLRSSNQRFLQQSKSRTVAGSRAFRHSSVTIWNSLPQHIRDTSTVENFRRKLKTHLFSVAFAI